MLKKNKNESPAERWKRIEEAMKLAGIESQSQLSRDLDIERQAISRWKSGATKVIPQKHYNYLSLRSGLTPSYIESGKLPKYLPKSDIQDRVLSALNLLPPEKQEDIAVQAEALVQREIRRGDA